MRAFFFHQNVLGTIMSLEDFDLNYLRDDHHYLLGSDEVGRGPLAGPVVAATVAVKKSAAKEFSKLANSLGVTDSKKLSDKKRLTILKTLGIELESLKSFVVYERDLFCFSLAELSPAEIDRHNILAASMMAMNSSREKLDLSAKSVWLVDGNRAPIKPMDHLDISCIVKGDQKSKAIALASVIAKSYRDHMMVELGRLYPGYGLEKHAGYPTATHREAIKTLGPSPVHRKSFKGVKEYVETAKGKTL